MISIIIASADKDMLSQIKKNIQATVGVPYEVLAFDNSDRSKGICEIYNEGAKLAKNPILCFMHEDILFQTNNWGKKVVDIFSKNLNLGLIGVAGNSFKSKTVSGWNSHGLHHRTSFINLYQYFKYIEAPSYLQYINPNNELLSKVVCVDGVWMCTPKKIALEFPFDEEKFKDFHCYDLDYSFSVNKKYDVAVTFEVLISHFSEGKYSNKWLEDSFILHKKWAKELPMNHADLSSSEICFLEVQTIRNLIADHYDKLTFFNCLSILNKSKILKYSFKSYRRTLRFISRKYRGKPV